ncbi:MAG: hypothetical protein HC821_04425, partial [Lewinella sp.]|nr:hypothetical protein [Lewinella sp.]
MLTVGSGLAAQTSCLDDDGDDFEALPVISYDDDDDDPLGCSGSTAFIEIDFADDDALHNIVYTVNGQQFSLNGANDNTMIPVVLNGITTVTLLTYQKQVVGCGGNVNQTITLVPADGPNLSVASQNQASCGVSNGSVTLAASGGQSPYSFSLGGSFQTSASF